MKKEFTFDIIIIITICIIIAMVLQVPARAKVQTSHMSRDDPDDDPTYEIFEGSTDAFYRSTYLDLEQGFDRRQYKTSCQQKEELETSYKVRCLEDGSFDPVQCQDETEECWCVDEDGEEIPGTIRMIPDAPSCGVKVRPTFTVTRSTSSSRQPIVEKEENPSSNYKERGHDDLITTEESISHTNEKANDCDDDNKNSNSNSNNNNEHSLSDDLNDNEDETDEDSYDVDDPHHHSNNDDDDDGGSDGVLRKNANLLFTKDPVYATGLILVVVLSTGILIVFAVFFIHRLKRKDEGSYTLATNDRVSTIGYSMTKNTEYFA